MAISPLYCGADMDVSYTGAALAQDGTPLNAGNCTYTLEDAEGTLLDSGSLEYVSGSSGNYLGVIQSEVTQTLVVDELYILTITFVLGDYDDLRVIPLRAANRVAA